jgi:predicted  nucleic acid-binding Zn-ribbon protein
MMWLLLVLAWLGFLAVMAVFAQQAFGYDLAGISADFLALPMTQRLATGTIATMAILLIGASIYQARKVSRQQTDLRLLRSRLKGARKDTAVADGLQDHFDEVVQHLVDNDLQETISSIQKKLTDAEQRAALQQSRNEATDIPDQLDDIRRRQQALRETIGVVAEKRRVTEPVFAEIKDRHRLLERSLSELEVDDNKNSLADRLKEQGHDVSVIQTRLNALQESLTTLNRFKEALDKSRAELVALRAPGTGIYALIDEVRPASEQLARILDELESTGGESLGSRVEALSRNKVEIEQRVARLDDCFNVLSAIRLDFEELRERQARLERSLAEAETDSSGKSLTDRQNTLNEFIMQSRLRLRALQDSFTTLNRFKEELAKSQADLVPLQAPVFGIEALIGEVHTNRDLVIKTLGEIESNGGGSLGPRVEELSTSKREIDERIADVFEHFTKLDSLRKDISGVFMAIRGTLTRIG